MTTYTGYSAGQGGVISTPEAIAYTPEIWMPIVIRYRQRRFGLANYITAAPFEGKKGDTVRMPYIGRLTPKKRVAGSPLQFETRAEGEWTMVCDREAYAAFSVDYRVDIESEINVASEYGISLGDALAEDIEYSLLAERATAISHDSTNQLIQSAAPIAYADILAAYEYMLSKDVDPMDCSLHVGPHQFATLFNIDEFIQSGTYNSGNIAQIRTGTVVGTILGMPVVLNQNIRRNSTTGLTFGGFDYDDTTNSTYSGPTPGMANSLYLPTQYGSDKDSITLSTFLTANYHAAFLIHKDFMRLAMRRQPTIEMWWNPDYQETRSSAVQLYDVKAFRPELAVVIETDEDGLI